MITVRKIIGLFALVSCLWMTTATFGGESPRKKYNFNNDWRLHVGDEKGAEKPEYDDGTWKKVDLPRAFNEDEAFREAIDRHTDTVVWYRKEFKIGDLKGKKVFAEFEGIRFGGDFYLNGEYLGSHENGVMAAGFDLTPYIKEGLNLLAVRIDNDWDYREKDTGTPYQWNNRNFNANYGGIPKNVNLYVTGNVYQTLPLYSNLGTKGVYVYATDFDIPARRAKICTEAEVKNESDSDITVTCRVDVVDLDGEIVAAFISDDMVDIAPGDKQVVRAAANVDGLHFWSWGYGYLYDVNTKILDLSGNVLDEVNTRTGFRKTRFGEGKIWLNDRVIQVHGYAQRTSNEWPGVGMSVPAWLSDYSNGMIVEGNGNVVRWMHVTPWKQDVESCDRVGLIQALPAGDAEKDCDGRSWQQRVELMRDAIIYNRNNPSVLFYESGNESISREHLLEMKRLRDIFDPHGGRAVGSREMLDINASEYGGEMLYINKSRKHPMWAMEYCRDEGLRKYWDEYSYPFHKEGEGNSEYLSAATNEKKKRADAGSYNHNQDMFAVELVRRWYDYWRERPGTGDRVSSGGVKIVFSDTNTHYRGVENYRRSGVTDAMRIPKDAYYVHQTMWNGWVDRDSAQTYIIGHWNYPENTVKPMYVVSNCDEVELMLNGTSLGKGQRQYNFLFTFEDVVFQPGLLEAVGYIHGKEASRYSLVTAGEPSAIRLTGITSPMGFHADGADMALLQFEIIDRDGNRCPLDNREVTFSLKGEGEWRGGIAQGPDNYILSEVLPVECGVNRALIRSTRKPGKIQIMATAAGLPEASIEFETMSVPVEEGLSLYLPSDMLPCHLSKGETPLTPSYTDTKDGIPVLSAQAGSNPEDAFLSYDDNELSEWKSDGSLENAWITYHLADRAAIDDICIKLAGWRSKSYPIEVYAGDRLIWSGDTEKSLGYVHLEVKEPVVSDTYTICLRGAAQEGDAFGQIKELGGGPASESDIKSDGKNVLRIVEVEFLR